MFRKEKRRTKAIHFFAVIEERNKIPFVDREANFQRHLKDINAELQRFENLPDPATTENERRQEIDDMQNNLLQKVISWMRNLVRSKLKGDCDARDFERTMGI